jgi:hypothetical protein
MADANTDAGLLTPTRKQVLIASTVLFVISLGVLIPALGIFIGFIFTITGGVAGGITIGALRKQGGTDGAKYGAIVGIVGGLPSSILGVVIGTITNFFIAASEPGNGDAFGGFVIFAIVGFFSGMLFKVGGATLFGALTGAILDERE